MTTSGPLARIRALFDAVRDVRAGDRASRLAELGATPAEAAEVLALCTAAAQDSAPLRAAAAAAAAPVDAAAPASWPQRFGPFVLRREIGRGGMGIVYEAEDTATGEVVALKRSRGAGVHATARERFVSEARLGAAIDDPHCVFVRSGGEVDGDLFLTMELLPGDNLRRLVERRGPLPVGEARTAILEVCRGLEALHAADIVHRDLKPENCLLTADGHVKVGDLGLSRTLSPAALHLTGANDLLGTPAFAPPEQLRGEPVDARADVYGATATLFFLLTGRPPFAGDSVAAQIARVVGDPVPTLRANGIAASPALQRLVQRGLAKSPQARFATIAELVGAIEVAMPDRPPHASALERIAAFVADWAVLFLLAIAAAWVVPGFDLLACTWQAVLAGDPTWAIVLALGIAAFAVTEGLTGRSPGKRWIGLRVLRTASDEPVGLARAAGRAAVVALAVSANEPIAACLDIRYPALWMVAASLPIDIALSFGVPFALLFAPWRRGTVRGLHDRLFGSRVVREPIAAERQPAVARTPMPAVAEPAVAGETDPFLGRRVLVVPADTPLHREFSPTIVGRERRGDDQVLLLAEPLGPAWSAWLAAGGGTWAEACDVLLGLDRALAWQPLAPDRLVVGARGRLRVLPTPRTTDDAPREAFDLAQGTRQLLAARGTHVPWSARTALLAAADRGATADLRALLGAARNQRTGVPRQRRFLCSLATATLFCAFVLVHWVLQVEPRLGRFYDLDRGAQLAALIHDVATGETTRATFAEVVTQGCGDPAQMLAAADAARERLARERLTRQQDGQRTLLLLPHGVEPHELLYNVGSTTFAFSPREAKHHAALLRKWDDWCAGRFAARQSFFRQSVLWFPVLGGIAAALAGFATRGRWPFRWAGLALIDARGRDLARGRAAWHAAIVFVPVVALVWLAEWADVSFERGTLVCGLVYWLIFLVAIGYPLLAFRLPERMPHDVLAGTRVVAR